MQLFWFDFYRGFIDILCSLFYRVFFLAFFTEKMWRFYKDFYVCYKISVNFGHNLQGKHKDFTNILCDLDAQNVVKSTDIL